jgi:hypothetical protein
MQQYITNAAPAGGPESVGVSASAMLSGAECLAIYRRSYQARLVNCFQEMFPALLHALGVELFNAFAVDYLRVHPPATYTLNRLADHFPAHLARTRPTKDEAWPDFLIELAELELALRQVYDGPGAEGFNLPDAHAIQALSPAQMRDATAQFVPNLRRFALRYPTHDYICATRRQLAPALPAPQNCFAVLFRRDYQLSMLNLTAAQFTFLQELATGRTAPEAIQEALPENTSPTFALNIARDWLSFWAEHKLLAAIIF